MKRAVVKIEIGSKDDGLISSAMGQIKYPARPRLRIGVKRVRVSGYINPDPLDKNSKCECAHHSCGCCVHLEAEIIELNSKLCTQVTYLSKSYGISFILDLNDKVIVNKTTTVEELSHKCYNVPQSKRVVQICVGFYKVEESNNQLSCCLEAILNVKNDRIARAVFGCFHMPASHV
ncbi:Hypothetical predicted protein [Cloeon dipterum]|uniref:DUF4773 domain-containing protein n=1 Tax=Cloeon dipterum TaxID=197152 RepID=A0A8S1C8N7_9INSE|nr:Hypothetical predicted protein [Cloeon dipterum]